MKKLITLSCIVFYAIIAHAQSAGDYRTVATGNWNNIAIWERYNGTAWKPATAYPTSGDGAITIKDGNNVTLNLSLTIDQTTVDGGGQLTITSNYTLTLNDGKQNDLTINGLLYTTTGTITGTGNLVINNAMKWDGGSVQVVTTNNGRIVIENSVTLSALITNAGTINWVGGQIVFSGGSINNNNLINCYSNSNLYSGTGSGTITNNKGATINVNVAGTLSNRITINNKGTVNFNSGIFSNDYGLFTNTKTMNFNGGFFQTYSTTNLNAGTKITGSGIFSLNDNTLNVNTAVSIPSGVRFTIYTSGPLLSGTGSLTVNGDFYWLTGAVSIPVTINSSGMLILDYDNVTLTSSITNNGTINWSWGNIYFSGGVLTNNKTLNISGDFQFISNPSGSFINNESGVVTKTSLGTTTINIPFNNKGTIAGSGTFAFGTNLTNSGTFDPGIGSATDILTTGTDYKNETLNIKITGSSAGLDFDRLLVNGNAMLNGSTLKVTASGNVPAGDYVILSCTGTRSGQFSTLDLPSGYTVTYKSNQVIVNVPENFSSQSTNQANAVAKAADATLLSLFPTVATQNINVNFQSKSKSASLKIFDENGKPVLQKNITPSILNNINISKLTAGSYFIQINDGAATQSAKFIKQ